MPEIQIFEILGRTSLLRPDKFQLVAGSRGQRVGTLGADRDPVQPLGQGQRAVALHAKLEPEGVQAIDKLAGELQGRFAAREHDVGLAPAVGFGIEHRKGGGDGLRQFLSRGENPGVRADEIRVAEPAFRRGPILGAARPEVAPGKAAEHRRTPGLCALAL